MNVRLTVSIIYLLILFVFVSCNHKPDETPPVSESFPPSISFIVGYGFTANDIEIQRGSLFNVGIAASPNLNKTRLLRNFTITTTRDSVVYQILDSSINTTEFTYIDTFTAQDTAIVEYWEFTITDEAGEMNKVGFSVTTKDLLPSLYYVLETNYLATNELFSLAIGASSNEYSHSVLRQIKILREFELYQQIQFDSTIYTVFLNLIKKFNASPEEGEEIWYVIVNDLSGASDTVKFSIYTSGLITQEYSGEIWNYLGTNNQAWDLVLNIPKTTSDFDKDIDMINITDTQYYFPPYYFLNAWKALNTTLFKKANYFDYDNASIGAAVDIFTGATMVPPSPYATGLAKGDIFISRLRNTDEYAIIRIDSVIFTEYDHLDKIEFSYKKDFFNE